MYIALSIRIITKTYNYKPILLSVAIQSGHGRLFLDLLQQNTGPSMIKQLSQEVAEDLCAQQVITSICDCIKELVDNSIDANSTKITILLDQYGKQRIRVKDDGIGIENFQFLARKGSTSKNKGNYQEVQTLGFRGEALHSLAKVSQKMIIESCHKSRTIWYDVKQNTSRMTASTRDDGTFVEIESLFEYLPVRRYELLNKCKQFLKKIDEMIRQYCIIYPHISFVLRNTRDGKADIILETTAHNSPNLQQDWFERIRQVLGMKMSENLLYMKTDHVEGWILKNIESGSSKQNTYIRKTVLYTYLNKRPIDPILRISHTFEEYYKKYNRSTKYIYIINIILPWDTYDVNLTPNKREIFIKEQLLTKIINQIRQFIGKNVIEIVPVLEQFQEKERNKMVERMANFVNNAQTKKKDENLRVLAQKQGEQEPYQRRIEANRKLQTNQKRQNIQRKPMSVNDISKQIKQNNKNKLKEATKNKLIQSLNQRMSLGTKKITEPHRTQRELGRRNYQQKDQRQVQKKEQAVRSESNKNEEEGIDQKQEKIINKLDQNVDEKLKQVKKNEKKQAERLPNNPEQQILPQKFSCTLNQQSFTQFKVIGQFNHGFIVCLFDDKYYLVDQHAASEKYHFERILKSKRNRAQVEQQIELSSVQIETILEKRDSLVENGYKFQVVGKSTVLLKEIPVFLGKSYGKQYFLDIITHNKCLNELPDYYNAAATKACRTAVMVGDVLRPAEMKTIVAELSSLQSPWNCPHGRPTLIYLGSRAKIEGSVGSRQNRYNLGIE